MYIHFASDRLELLRFDYIFDGQNPIVQYILYFQKNTLTTLPCGLLCRILRSDVRRNTATSKSLHNYYLRHVPTRSHIICARNAANTQRNKIPNHPDTTSS